MNVLRRHPCLRADVRRVIAHLTAHKKIVPNDILNRPRLKRKKGQSAEEPIPWAHAPLVGSWQQAALSPGPNNSKVLYTKESDVWKLVVPQEDVEAFLRKQLLDPQSTMPLGRDSAYHHVSKTTVGISRRALYKFLEKQQVLQISRNIPDEQKKGGRVLTKRGYCEMDLIEGSGKDLYKNFGPRGDWYWLSVIECLTGYGVVIVVATKQGQKKKAPAFVAPRLREVLNLLEHKLKAKVFEIAADHGREFYTDVRTLLKKRHIKQRQISKGARVEKFNQDFQRNFYRLLRLRRGTFGQLEDQALALCNNTRNKNLKMTPNEALSKPDAELVPLHKRGRAQAKPYRAGPANVGDKCRHLVKLRKNITGGATFNIGPEKRAYKSYHGRHFTKQLYTISAVYPKKPQAPDKRQLPRRYYVNGAWRNRDQILVVSGTDAKTDEAVASRGAYEG